MPRIPMNNLNIPPLAGVCTYEESFRPGYSVDRNVELLKRYNYIATQLNAMYAAHLPSIPEWEVKCGISLHMWLDAEHATMLRKRVSEMREPPLLLDKVPDERLRRVVEEAIRSRGTIEWLVAVYRVLKPEWVGAMNVHIGKTNPLIDHPTWRMLKAIVREQEEMIEWGEAALSALTITAEDRSSAREWESHLRQYLLHAQGVAGDSPDEAGAALPEPRYDGKSYEMDVVPRRDERFRDNFNRSAKVDEYYGDDGVPFDERTYSLLYKRLREMDVPEYMCPIIYKTRGKPWEYYADLSRQLWDECRHAMMGEIGYYYDGMRFSDYPVDLKASMVLNTDFTPLETHILLWGVEQRLMPKSTGKHWEWEIAKASGNPLFALFQDHDWADEVLHAQIGRKWLVPEVGGMAKLTELGDEMWVKFNDCCEKWASRSEQKEWWPEFIAEMRKRRQALIESGEHAGYRSF